MQINLIACKHCGSHALDERGNCAGCGAPLDYLKLENNTPRAEIPIYNMSVSCSTNASPEMLQIWWEQTVQVAAPYTPNK